MTYAVSDIHGRYDAYRALLERLSLGADDTLYVLGDVLDRGPDGFRIILDMAGRSSVSCLLGNHEAMALRALPCILRALEPDAQALREEDAQAVALWFRNGGKESLTSFLDLDGERKRIAWDYLRRMPLYREVEAGGRRFVLVHGGLEGFSPSRPLEDYGLDEILWRRPKPDMVYFPDKYLVFGHTPVQLLRREAGEPALPKIYRKGTAIAIDCGCAMKGGRLGCLCLDTMEELYI